MKIITLMKDIWEVFWEILSLKLNSGLKLNLNLDLKLNLELDLELNLDLELDLSLNLKLNWDISSEIFYKKFVWNWSIDCDWEEKLIIKLKL